LLNHVSQLLAGDSVRVAETRRQCQFLSRKLCKKINMRDGK